jgi:competence CoiA-like predicted nuclease
MNTRKRTIESILDLKTGKIIEADIFFNQSKDIIFNLRLQLESDIQNERKRFVCIYCKQSIKIRGKIGAKIVMHFAHFKDSEDCPIKTDSKFTKKEIERIKYNGAKESDLHLTLKNKIAQYLIQNKNSKLEIKNVLIEKVQKDKRIPRTWKKPDVSAVYKNLNVVFELQLSTTFLSVIVDRQEFYKRNKTFILWVFSHFENKEEKRKFTQSDIFYSNNQNGFELNKKAQQLSEEKKDLVLCCHYSRPLINNLEISFKWEHKYVTISELTFNNNTFQVFYFDVKSAKKEIEKELELRKSKFLGIIANGTVKELLELFQYHQLKDFEKVEIESQYKHKVSPKFLIERESEELKIIWTLIAQRLKENYRFNLLTDDYITQKVLIDILSLKTNKIIGYHFKKQIQIAHNLLDRHPEFLYYYEKAIDKYKNIGFDNGGKLKTKIENIKKKEIDQEHNNIVIETIFPELLE